MAPCGGNLVGLAGGLENPIVTLIQVPVKDDQELILDADRISQELGRNGVVCEGKKSSCLCTNNVGSSPWRMNHSVGTHHAR